MPAERRPGVPWARTWMALAVASVVVGALFASLPYDRATLVVAGGEVVVRCEPPVLGAFGDDALELPGDAADGESIRQDCPVPARERLALGAVLILAGMVGFVVVRRLDRQRRGLDRRR